MEEADALIEGLDYDQAVLGEFMPLMDIHSQAQLQFVRQALITRCHELSEVQAHADVAKDLFEVAIELIEMRLLVRSNQPPF